MREAAHWRARHPDWIITSSAHSLRALMGAHHLDAVFLSPVFPTTSHKDAEPLTPLRAAMIASHAPVPVYALGGITARNAVINDVNDLTLGTVVVTGTLQVTAGGNLSFGAAGSLDSLGDTSLQAGGNVTLSSTTIGRSEFKFTLPTVCECSRPT